MNQVDTIKRLLEHSGLHVYGITDGSIVIEDPTCIIRGFQEFFKDAWIALSLITGLMIVMWGIGKIRGAKFSELGYFKNLMMIFIVLSMMFPILNVIYGGDLFGMGCQKMKVSLDEVQSLLSSRAKTNADSMQFEDIDIYDSGPIYSSGTSTPTPPDIDYWIDAADAPDDTDASEPQQSLQQH